MRVNLSLHWPKMETDVIGFFQKFENAISSEGSKYQKVLKRAQDVQGELVNDIFAYWEQLQFLAGSYSEVLDRRWGKKTVQKRKAILLEAWPGMNPRHRPDFDAIRRQLKGPAHRDAIMMPYINLEDLSWQKNLLSLIHTRTKRAPEHFAWVDSSPYETAATLDAVEPAPHFHKVMLLTGQTTRTTYGSLQDVSSKKDDVEDIVWTGFGFQLGKGLVILETQKQLYSFLLRCTEILLHDIDLSKSTTGTTTVHSQHNMRVMDTTMSADSKEWHSVSEMNTHASYHLPQTFSMEFLRRLAVATLEEAEDHFWALHEDPAYFQAQLDMQVQQHTEPCRRIIREVRWSYTAEDMALKEACKYVIHHACRDIILWKAIAADIVKLEHLRTSLNVEIQLSKRLPREYEKALESFIVLVNGVWRYAVNGMYRVLLSSADLSKFFKIVPCTSGGYADFQLKKLIQGRPQILNCSSTSATWGQPT